MPNEPAGATVTADGGPGVGGATLSAPPPAGSMPRAVALTPAVRGYPGGIADVAGEQEGLIPGEPATETGAGAGQPAAVPPAQGISVWQQSLTAWREAGIGWERAVPHGPGVADDQAIGAVQQYAADLLHTDDHTQPIPVVPAFEPPAQAGPAARPSQPAVAQAADAGDDLIILASGIGVAAGGAGAGDAAGAPAAGDGGAEGDGGAPAGDGGAESDGGAPAGDGGVPKGDASAAAGDGGAAGQAVRRRPRRRVTLIALAASVLAAGTVTAIAVTGSGGSGGPGFGVQAPYPPATALHGDFTGQPAAAMPPALTGVAAAGDTVVAVGAQAGQPFAQPLILDSTDGGRVWARAALAGASAAPGLGQVPVLVAADRGNWLALGQHSAWLSPNGWAWQAAPGVPMRPGDKVLGLARTRAGFVAVGENVPGPAPHGQPSPVLWMSTDGRTWQRRSGAALGLTAGGGGTVAALRWAAYRAQEIVIAGEVSQTVVQHPGSRKVTVSVLVPALWRSKNDGVTWQQVTLPAGHGATSQLAGLAAGSDEFVAIRPGRTGTGHGDAMAYVSGRGSAWRFAGRLDAGRRAPLRISTVAATGQGFVAAGSAGASRVVFLSTTGTRWRLVAGQGMAATRTVAGVTVLPHGVVVVAGARRQPGSGLAGQSPSLLLAAAGARAKRSQVGQAVLSAATTDVTVTSIAAASGQQVAAGSAGGLPALWQALQGGGWTPAAASMPASWRPGELTSVVHGGAGWLAVGRTGVTAPYRPVIMTSVASAGTWTPGAGSQPLTAPGVTLTQAAAGPTGYVVVGSQANGGTLTAAAWFSGHLTTWTRAGQGGARGAAPGSRGVAGAAGQMLAVTTARPGFVAVGYAGRAPGVWTSPGGSAWRLTVLPRPAGAASAALTTVAAVGGRVVAAGYASGPSAAGRPPVHVPFAAVSGNDGRTWHESVLTVSPGPAGVNGSTVPAAVTAMTAAGNGFMAAGLTGPAGKRVPACWWSPSGLSWHGVRLRAAGLRGGAVWEITALNARGGVLTGVGYAVTGPGEQPVLWRARYR